MQTPTIPVFMQNRRHHKFPPPGKTLITVSGNGAIDVVPEAEDEDEKSELSLGVQAYEYY